MTPDLLPDHYLITPEPDPADRAGFVAKLSGALQAGIRLVQFRAPALASEVYGVWAEALLPVCRAHGARLILNGPPGFDAGRADADGVHLNGARLAACMARPAGPAQWVSAACHDLDQLRHAQRIGADFATLSPVLATRTHPDAVPLGWSRFAELVAQVEIPVYALGGMTLADTATAQSHGARGIAAIRGLWPEV